MKARASERSRRRQSSVCLTLLVLLGLTAWRVRGVSAPSPTEPIAQKSVLPGGVVIEVMGRTQCIGSRKSIIAPVPLHPVTAVRVEPGSRVKKGQLLVKLDDDEPQADVRAKQAALESAQLTLQEARRHSAAVEKALVAVSEQLYFEIRLRALTAERDERMAKAAWESSKAELEHYEITAQIDGVVSWLNVHLGMVSRPGTTVWGEIVDLREIDVDCELTLEQVERVSIGQSAEVRKGARKDLFGTGRVVYVGIEADARTELVPVHVRVSNSDERLRCREPVQVRFTNSLGVSKAD
jgi:RND family efflux transporter MFP subunit